MTKKKRKRKFGLIHLLTLFIMVYIITVVWNQRSLMKKLEGKKEENILVNQEIQKDITKLEKQIEDSQTLQFVEKIAREELGMVKPKEIIVIDKNKDRKSKSVFKTTRK